MCTKLTVIVDNIAKDDIKGEWGLCILVEHENKKILVDAGGSGLFGDNLKKLGFRIDEIDYAVLSHAHYDHANGMLRFFAENENAKFYLRDQAKENCYSKYFFVKNYIGLPKNILKDYADRIELVSGDFSLCEGAYLIPHKTPNLARIGRREMMYQKTQKGFVPDDFSHEQSLVLDTKKGLVIINSCSHGGTVNIIKEIMMTFPEKKVYALIGGFHLFNKRKSEIKAIAKELKALGVQEICTGHCTQGRAYHIMREEIGDMVKQFYVGFETEY